MEYLEQAVEINGLHYAFRLWGEATGRPIMALHGWLDNAASFNQLAPLLGDSQMAAIDLAGHGLSGHRHPQAGYNLWDDLLDLLALADHLGWDQFTLMGHSRGAMIAVLLAASMPKRISSLVLIDGVTPLPVEPEQAPEQLRKYLSENRNILRKKLPSYQTREQALAARCRSSGLSEVAAEQLLSRGLEAAGEGYQWRADPRLTTASAFKLSHAHSAAMLSSLSVPTLICLASQGFGAYPGLDELLSQYQDFQVQHFEGSHHFHMEKQVDQLAETINQFFNDNAIM